MKHLRGLQPAQISVFQLKCKVLAGGGGGGGEQGAGGNSIFFPTGSFGLQSCFMRTSNFRAKAE